MRKRARVDDNHATIVAALRAIGARVLSLAPLGNGAPDLLVKFGNPPSLLLLEVKDGTKEPARRRLTPAEARFHVEWSPPCVVVVESVPQAVAAVRALCGRR